VLPLRPEVFEALRMGGREVLRPLLQTRGVPNSDFFPMLDLGAERMRFMRQDADGYISLSEGGFDVVAALTGRRAGFGTQTLTPTPEVERALALAEGARLRAIRTMPDLADQVVRTDDTRAALQRLDFIEKSIASSEPPADWRSWLQQVERASLELHGGTAGVADSMFFRPLHAYASRAGAPAEVRAGLNFLEGIAAWDWPKVVVAAGSLVAADPTEPWISETLLRNGAVVGHIRLGNVNAAKETLREFANRTTEDRFREQVLASYVMSIDSTARRPVVTP
jgi:hypothetical protein